MSLIKPKQQQSLHLQMGTTLMEVLVSLLVLSFGMLGMAGVQSVSLRNNQSAYYRTQATTLTADMIERMRANKTGVANANYDDVAGGATAACFTVAGCTAAQMAAQDVLDWTALVVAAFPGGDSVVCIDSSGNDGTTGAQACDGAGNIYAVKIWWDDDRDGTAETLYATTWQPL
jgi:type IV pilus assembly protein PilV